MHPQNFDGLKINPFISQTEVLPFSAGCFLILEQLLEIEHLQQLS